MPAKKKSKKKKEKTEAKGEVHSDVTVLDKQYYLTQIQSLERNLDRANQMCEQLSSAERFARNQYRDLHEEKSDIAGFLKERLKSKEDEIEELRNRLSGLLKASVTDKEESEGRLKTLRLELEQTKGDLSDKILSLTRKLDSLEEFRQQKEKIDAEHIALTEQLEREREENKEKLACLERSSIEEREVLVRKHNQTLAVLTEELREVAKQEVHATTKCAIAESRAQSKSISTMRTKILKLRRENIDLRNNLREKMSREVVLRDSLEQMSSISERRALALRKVVERAMEHSDVRKDYEKTKEEKETLKRDLQQTQLQLDAATRMSCDIRENSSEKSIALDLLSAKLQEEKTERKKLTSVLHTALQMLQENIFSDSELATDEHPENPDTLNATLKHLVDILSEAEQSLVIHEEVNHKDDASSKAKERRSTRTEALATYTAGDLGLVPRNGNSKK